MDIQTLPPTVAAQIAAGEVVERPASVVKELVENALDADASAIQVSIRQGGTSFIQVVDNGHGIPADQVAAAFGRHATSKLRTADDLTHIATLGFRGEALPSIAAVSQLTCTTGVKDQPAAARYIINYGLPVGPPQPAGAPPGVNITVVNLFGNQPARLKFLKTKPTEAGQVQRVVARYAMAYPSRRFTYHHDDNPTFATYGSGKLNETIRQLMGQEVATNLLPVLLETENAVIDGYIGNPDLHRSNRNDITIIVNGRWVQDRNLSYAVEQGYQNSFPPGRRPIAVISITVPPELVDVNAHPTKQEVRFRHESQLFGAVQRAVRESLSAHGMAHQPAPRPFTTAPAPHRQRNDRNLLPESPTHQAPPTRPHTVSGLPPRATTTPPRDAPPLVTTDLAPRRNLRDIIPQLQLIGQAQQTYILADGPDALYVLDQHAAHERAIFDRIFRTDSTAPAVSQPLIIPVPVLLDEFQHELLTEHRELLIQHGFALRQGADSQWEISALPHPLTRDHSPDPAHVLQRLLDEFATDLIINPAHQALAATIACHSAVRAGDRLNPEQQQSIIDQLAATPEPHRCPHGRPILVAISQLRLEQEFRRR